MVELVGVDALLRQLGNYAQIRDEEYETAALQGMNVADSRAADYPDVPPYSTYQRTFTLHAGWFEEQMIWDAFPDGFLATTVNPVWYGPYVQGDADQTPTQALMHAGLWKPTSTILDEAEPEILAFFDQATERIVRRLGN